jgi:uncharacterized DUF497 family protein
VEIFRWDPRKAAINLKKHGIDFREAATVFNDPLSVTFPDADHSEREQRFLTIGQSLRMRVLVIAHTEDSDTDSNHQRQTCHPARARRL